MLKGTSMLMSTVLMLSLLLVLGFSIVSLEGLGFTNSGDNWRNSDCRFSMCHKCMSDESKSQCSLILCGFLVDL